MQSLSIWSGCKVLLPQHCLLAPGTRDLPLIDQRIAWNWRHPAGAPNTRWRQGPVESHRATLREIHRPTQGRHKRMDGQFNIIGHGGMDHDPTTTAISVHRDSLCRDVEQQADNIVFVARRIVRGPCSFASIMTELTRAGRITPAVR